MNDIKSFVALKYQILSSDSDMRHLCNTYPPEVRSKWAWRCAGDVEHLAKGHPEAENLIRVAKKYRDGLATQKELAAAAESPPISFSDSGIAWNAADASFYACLVVDQIDIGYTIDSIQSAADAVACLNMPSYDDSYDTKLNEYIEWLIEELCEYESNHNQNHNLIS